MDTYQLLSYEHVALALQSAEERAAATGRPVRVVSPLGATVTILGLGVPQNVNDKYRQN